PGPDLVRRLAVLLRGGSGREGDGALPAAGRGGARLAALAAAAAGRAGAAAALRRLLHRLQPVARADRHPLPPAGPSLPLRVRLPAHAAGRPRPAADGPGPARAAPRSRG